MFRGGRGGRIWAGTAVGVGREWGPELGERATEMLEDLRKSSRTGRESRRGGLRKIESNRFFCNQWHWWVITHQLHEEVQKRRFRSSK